MKTREAFIVDVRDAVQSKYLGTLVALGIEEPRLSGTFEGAPWITTFYFEHRTVSKYFFTPVATCGVVIEVYPDLNNQLTITVEHEPFEGTCYQDVWSDAVEYAVRYLFDPSFDDDEDEDLD